MSDLFDNERRSLFNIYDDWVFHYIFSKGTEKTNRALIGILNVILNRIEDPIQEIQIENPIEQGDRKDDKETILDIKATANSGELIDIEMQNGKPAYFENRNLFYACRLGNSSLEKSQNYGMMEKSIVISIVNGRLFSSSKKLHTVFKVLEETEHFQLSDRMEIHFVDLSKIDGKKAVEEMEPLERLATYIKYAGKKDKETYLHTLLDAGEETITMVEGLFKELTEDKKAYERRERELKGTLDRNTAIYAAKLEGKLEGQQIAEARYNALISRLLQENRLKDLQKATDNKEFREELYREFNL